MRVDTVIMTDIEKQRFWSRVIKSNDNSCWDWRGATYPGGYGQLLVGGRLWRANRLSWILHFGDIPTGMNVLHKCDNPRCCNPDHLFLGSQHDNVMDMVNKGRHNNGHAILRGETHWKAKLKAEQVREIRMRYANGGITTRQLSAKYGVNQRTIMQIIHREIWQDVE